MEIINIRQHPQYLDAAANYFSSRWDIDRQLYTESMTESLYTKASYPRWYIMPNYDAVEASVVGGFGIVEHDFMADGDFCPWLCALYVEQDMRGQHLGRKLLDHGVKEAAKLGIDRLYLNTDHVGYYEKYGWQYMGDFLHQDGKTARVFSIDTK